MQIGFDPRSAALAQDPEQLVRVMTEGEAMGFDYTTLSDHLVFPRTIDSRYPYDPSGKVQGVAAGPRHEALTAIAFLAAKTSRLRFVTSVMVVPYRPALFTAKIVSTIDVLSGGRITLGVGTGWMKEEFDAVGAPDYSVRGRATDEYIEAYKALWTQENPQYSGEYVRFSNLFFEPKPVQKPHPPLWVGGLSNPALRRAARLGDAWYPVPDDQLLPLDSFPRMQAGIAKLREFTEAAGRPAGSVAVALRMHKYGHQIAPQASDGERQLFSGSTDDIVSDLERLSDMGLTAVDFRFTEETPDKVLAAMASFKKNVLDKFKR